MSKTGLNGGSLKNILRGGGVWLISLLLLTVIAAILVGRMEIHEKTIVYISSALPFISAAIAGNTLRRKKEKMLCCLLLSFFLIIIALSFGFFADSQRLESGSILSAAISTLCGSLTGYILELPKKKRSRIKLSS